MPATPLHQSVRTSTTLNTSTDGRRWLTVSTARLSIERRGDLVFVAFTATQVQTEVVARAANDPQYRPAAAPRLRRAPR
jgi:hypothetical protein